MNSEKGTEEIRERDFILEAPVISPFSISQHFLPACKNVRNFSSKSLKLYDANTFRGILSRWASIRGVLIAVIYFDARALLRVCFMGLD